MRHLKAPQRRQHTTICASTLGEPRRRAKNAQMASIRRGDGLLAQPPALAGAVTKAFADFGLAPTIQW